ncbi:hypothetical protein [Actinomadura atramentaria]|uniref:hypothetical protein n=1 Tax=Actinomadura atramentaria TaxID=1990 RepID=UPI000370F9AE|nr:hypothetical protein [Actinomadura atramentaria]
MARRAEPGGAARPLIRAQRRAALRTAAFVLAVLAALPVAPALAPVLGHVRACGVPLPWPLLAVAVQPVLIAAAVRQARRAERIEREYLRGPAADDATARP